MKISIELAKLIEVVEIAARFVSKNSTLPILQNLYLKASIDTLTLKATDMEKYVEIEVPCAIALEGAITVNAKMFLDLLKVMEEETIEISLNAQSQQIQLRSSKDTFDLNGISAGEYVALPEVPQTNTVVLDTQTFLQGIDHVEYTITEKNFSPVLTGVLVKTKTEATGKKMVFVGTDSFRIAEFKLNSQVDADFSLIIPKVAINDMRSITKFAIESELPEMTMKFSENLVAFEYQIGTTKIVATTLLIQGAFPDYEREEIIPTHFNTTILVDKTLCEKAIKKI